METKSTIKHTHKADSCCTPEQDHAHSHTNSHDHDHDHDHGGEDNLFTGRWTLWLSLLLLAGFFLATLVFAIQISRFGEFAILSAAYLLAGHKTIAAAFRRILRADFFNEFTLMTIATLGAFYIGEYSEAVVVMIFYEIGELFQELAVNRSKRSIKALLDIRPDKVTIIENSETQVKAPADVQPGETILVKAGERVALDGVLLSGNGVFNTAALTGEAKPQVFRKGEKLLAGMISTERTVEIEVTTLFRDSKLSRILEMVQEATARKAPTQLLISRLARIYTPIVFLLAVLIIAVPFLFVNNYSFDQWLYRGMVFLVIACPCALTISIPLGYFGGIGLASRNGILVKGANFLDVMTKIDTIVSDKTGTLTEGVFEVQQVEAVVPKEELILAAASLESYSTHPVARAVVSYAGGIKLEQPLNVEEIAGHGLKGFVQNKEVLAGNARLLDKFNITFPANIADIVDTLVIVAIDKQYAGHFIIADKLKEDAPQTVAALNSMGIETVMLSGDKTAVVTHVAKQLQIAQSYGDLLPEDKVAVVQKLKDEGRRIAFVGDGVNDAPVIALADAGIAMGALGSDAAIETADIVIQNDQPSKIISAIKAGKLTKSVVYQNITLAMVVKVAVMLLGAGGIATLWEAVFADVGVALLAILNAFRIQNKSI